MADELSGDLADTVVWGADMRRARFRDVDLTGTTMHNVWLVDVALDGQVDGLVVNGVDVSDFVNANDPWQPLRSMLRPTDLDGLRATTDAIEVAWADTIDQARQSTDAQLRESVGGEWSFVQTLRHLVFCTDKWFTVPILGGGFDPTGIPNTGSADHPWPDLDPDVDPSLDDVLAVREAQRRRLREYFDTMTADDPMRQVEVPENGTVPMIECFYTVFEEEFEHRRYALRDLPPAD